MGYATAFYYELQTIKAPATACLPQEEKTLQLERVTSYREDVCLYLNRKLQERPCCIQHTATDFNVILEDLKIGEGCIYILRRKATGGIAALAVTYPDENNRTILHVAELVAESEKSKAILLSYIARETGVEAFQLITPPAEKENALPLGMARIVQAKVVLQLYATKHPEQELNIALTDEQLSANNGYYYLNNGKCMFSLQRLPGSHRQLNISELTELILTDEHPYMSLMLN